MLAYSTTYYWQIISRKSGCSGVPGPVWRFTTEGCLPIETCPGNLHASDGVFADRVVVSWTAVTNASKYEIFRASAACAAYEWVGETSNLEWSDRESEPLRAYWYVVRACNACGSCGGFSDRDVGYAGSPGGEETGAVFRVEAATGTVRADGDLYGQCYFAGSADIAEWVPVSGPVGAGTVLELDTSNPVGYRPSQMACSALVAGVVSYRPGMVLGGTEPAEGMTLLALTGIVPVKVTDEGGPIQPGDLLVSSSTPGYAMRWAGGGACPCAIVGKALEPMTDESGVISVLLTAH